MSIHSSVPSLPDSVRVACHAMATRFEILLYGDDPRRLRGAGEEALHEIQRLESQLNFYDASSELTGINARAARFPVKVEPALFSLLQWAGRLHEDTSHAFDITVAPLMQCWGFVRATGHVPNPTDLEAARDLVGMRHVELDEARRTVRFAKEGVKIDLGAIGKGYAIEQAAEILRDNGIASALVHGGTSTLFALGQPPGESAWNVAIEFQDPTASHAEDSAQESRPAESCGEAAEIPRLRPLPAGQRDPAGAATPSSILAVVALRDEALSVSAVWGKAFQSENKLLGHVLDPRTGHPANHAMLGAAVLPSATESDAWSTALLIGGRAMQEIFREKWPDQGSLVAGKNDDSGEVWVDRFGMKQPSGALS